VAWWLTGETGLRKPWEIPNFHVEGSNFWKGGIYINLSEMVVFICFCLMVRMENKGMKVSILGAQTKEVNSFQANFLDSDSGCSK